MECVIAAVVIIGMLFVLAVVASPGRCSICNVPIKKKYYKWRIDGKKSRLCPKCNGQMERKVSRDAFKSRYG
jgi:ribosome-binding protein aMBF1 (putative translation factor)